ncbi:hypothetical protein N9219_05035 [bacterium]|nr:hypothetical protein [bacterium]
MKKRYIIVLTIVMAFALSFTPFALATDDGGKATGGVGFEQGPSWVVSFNAQIGPKGDAKGVVQAHSDGDFGSFHGKVTCYYQDGNMAWFSGPATYRDNISQFEFTGFLIGVEDNSEPGTAADPDPDFIRVRFLREQDSDDCTNVTGLPLNNPVLNGNLQVHEDANGL